MYAATCRYCKTDLVSGEECSHIRLGDDGQVYLQHPGHANEPDPYTEVTAIPDLRPGTVLIDGKAVDLASE